MQCGRADYKVAKIKTTFGVKFLYIVLIHCITIYKTKLLNRAIPLICLLISDGYTKFVCLRIV